MTAIFPVPIYRFLSQKSHEDDLLNGKIRFSTIKAFTELNDPKYKDDSENWYKLKVKVPMFEKVEGISDFSGYLHTIRKIEDAWAFSATTSIVSSARKPFCVYIKNFGSFLDQLNEAIIEQFGEELVIFFGPISYYDRELDSSCNVPHSPYFMKLEEFKNDLEFRIVILPSERIYQKGELDAITLQIKKPDLVFEKTLIWSVEK